MAKKKCKKNPILIKVNDEKKRDKLFAKAQKLKPDLCEDDFDEAIGMYVAQHGDYPLTMKVVDDVPGIDDEKVPVLIKAGRVKEFYYEPHEGSRKAPYRYVHKTKDEGIYTDAKGRTKILLGNMQMKSDGWFHH